MAKITVSNDDPAGPGDELSEVLVIIGSQQAGVISHSTLSPGQSASYEVEGDNALTVSKRWRDAVPQNMPTVN